MTEQKDEIIYIQCDKELKKEFYKIAKEKGFSPNSLIRAFIRKMIQEHKNKT